MVHHKAVVAHDPVIKREIDELLPKGATELATDGTDYHS